ncbi:hypothetical protein KAH27_02730 [bacterium]|nr:hypothetical protein [bacterium]
MKKEIKYGCFLYGSFITSMFVLFLVLAVAVFVFFVVLSDDIVKTEFSSLQEAKKSGAFERGWLPPILPETSQNIVEINDLDINNGWGSFNYDINERELYIQKLIQKLGAKYKTNNNIEILTFTKKQSSWAIELPLKKGKGKYTIN